MIEGVIGALAGLLLSYLFSTRKIDRLQNKVELLVDVINKLEAKVESVNELRRELFDLEKRVSDNEAKIYYNSQDHK